MARRVNSDRSSMTRAPIRPVWSWRSRKMSRVFKRKGRDGRYWVEWRDESGTKRRRCIGTDRRQAEDALKVLEAQVVRRKNHPHVASGALLFADLVKMYLESVVPALRWRRHVEAILRELTAEFGTRRLSELTSREVEAYRSARLRRLKPATLNRHVAVLRRLFNLAIDWGVAEQNPCARVRSLQERNARERWLTHDEARRLVEVAAPHLKPAILLALNTGARKAELLSLRWADVNMATKTIAFTQTKSGRRRDVAMNPVVVDTLRSIKRQGEFVLMRDGCPLGDFKTAFHAACRRAGIEPGFRWHDLRHTHAAHSVMAGTDLPTLQRRLGHASIAMTSRYSHLSSEHERKSVDAVALGVEPTVREGVVAFDKPLARRQQR